MATTIITGTSVSSSLASTGSFGRLEIEGNPDANIVLPIDGQQIQLGAGTDMKIYHHASAGDNRIESNGVSFLLTRSGVDRFRVGTTATTFNEPGNDINFRVEGNNDANLFTIDAGLDHIGIGKSIGNTGDEKLLVAGNVGITGSLHVSGNITTSGSIIAREFKTEFVSSSIAYSSGSTRFGDTPASDTHVFTGSLLVTGSGVKFDTQNVGLVDVRIGEQFGTYGSRFFYDGSGVPFFRLDTVDGGTATQRLIFDRVGKATLSTGADTVFVSGSVSGSIGSTGSFGMGKFQDTTYPNLTFPANHSADKIRFYDGGNEKLGTAAHTLIYTAASHSFKDTDGHENLLIGPDNRIYIPAETKLYLDGGGNTFIQESSADEVVFYVGGNDLLHLSEASTDYVFVPDNVKLSVGTGKDLTLYHDGTNSYLVNSTGNLHISSSTSDGDILFSVNDGGTKLEALKIDSSDVGAVKLPNDNQVLYIGAGNDSYFTHNGTNSIWGNNTGTLQIRNHTSDADMFLSVNDGGSHINAIQIDASAVGSVLLPSDNQYLKIGAGNDLTFVHNGTNSYIANATGHLYLTVDEADKNIVMRTDDGSGGVANYMILDGGSNIITVHKIMRFDDSIDLRLGTGSDLRLYHNATNSYIDNYTGDLYIRNTLDDKDIIFQSDDGLGGVTAYLTLDGSLGHSVINKNMRAVDSVKFTVGAADDASFYHDGTDSWLENGTGNLYIRNTVDDGDIIFQSDDASGGNATYLTINGGASLVDFAKATRHADSVTAYFGGGLDLRIYHNGSNSYIANTTTGDLYIQNELDDKDVILRSDDGLGGVTAYLTLDGSATSIKVAKNLEMADSVHLRAGTGDDLRIYHDGSNSSIENHTGNLYIDNNTDNGEIIFRCDDNSGGLTPYLTLVGTTPSVVINEDSADIDFRVESNGQSHMLFVNGGDDTVGIKAAAQALSASLQVGGGIIRTVEKIDGILATSQGTPVGHYSQGDEVFSIDPTWSDDELREFMGNNNQSFTASHDAPGGYAVYVDGYQSSFREAGAGMPVIPIQQGDVYHMEIWIKNIGTSQGHYVGISEMGDNFQNTGGNPGSYGYFVMANNNPGTSWTYYDGYVSGSHISNKGNFETSSMYMTPLSLFNYTAGSGTRACVYSGWRMRRVSHRGNIIANDNILVSGSIGIGMNSSATPDTSLDVRGSGVQGLVINQDEANADISSRLLFKEQNSTIALYNTGDTFSFRTGATIGSTSGTERASIGTAGIVSVGNFTTTGNAFINYGLTVNEGGNNADFRVESTGSTHMLLVDAENNRVGIGLASPAQTLDVAGHAHIEGNIYFGDDSAWQIDDTSWTGGSANQANIMLTGASGTFGFHSDTGVVNVLADGQIRAIADLLSDAGIVQSAAGVHLKLRRGTNDDDIITIEASETRIIGDAVERCKFGSYGLKIQRDDYRLWVGASDDFSIRHDGTNTSLINITGDLIVSQSASDADFYVKVNDGGTMKNAIQIDSSDNANVYLRNDSQKLLLGAAGDLLLYHDGSNSHVQNGTGVLYINNVANSTMYFNTNNTTRMAITNTGEVVISGNDTDIASTNGTGTLQVLGTGNSDTTMTIGRFSANASPPALNFVKSRHGTIGSNTIIQDDDSCGDIVWCVSDGSDLLSYVAKIEAEVDGTPGANDVPGRLTFYTTADGANGSVERMRITSAGDIGVGTTAPGYIFHTHDSGGDTRHKVSTSNHGTYYEAGVSSDSAGIILVAGHASSILNIYLQGSGGVGTVAQFQHDGDFHADGDVIAASTTVSDKRLKDNIKTIPKALDKVMKLRGVEFDWNKGGRKGQRDLGLIAQEVEKVLPELVREKKMALIDDKEYLTVDYDKMVAVLVEAIKEQQVQIDELKTKLGDK